MSRAERCVWCGCGCGCVCMCVCVHVCVCVSVCLCVCVCVSVCAYVYTNLRHTHTYTHTHTHTHTHNAYIDHYVPQPRVRAPSREGPQWTRQQPEARLLVSTLSSEQLCTPPARAQRQQPMRLPGSAQRGTPLTSKSLASQVCVCLEFVYTYAHADP